MNTHNPTGGESGFTLVEVALAVLAVGLGLVTIFALFPAGLQNASDDAADTRAGLFAGTVFNSMRGSAATISTTAEWDSLPSFIAALTVPGLTLKFDGSQDNILYPPSPNSEMPENHIRYMLSIAVAAAPPTVGPRPVYCATLTTVDGQYGVFSTQNVFYSEFFFTGN